jgi:dUTP pyrophosphatase
MLKLKRVHVDAKVPFKGSVESAGYDLKSTIGVIIQPWSRAIVPTGWAMTVPKGTYGRVAPRSGLAARNSIDVAAGVVDRDYTGEVKVILVNNSDIEFKVNVGDRIAQLIIEAIANPKIVIVPDLSETSRGSGGFGSTG